MFAIVSRSAQADGLSERYRAESASGQWPGLFPFFGPLLIFVVLKLFNQAFPSENYRMAWSPTIFLNLVLLVYFGAYVLGWKRGFPRWWFAYPVTLALITLLLQNTAIPGVSIFGFRSYPQAWGWRAWLPFTFATLLAVLISLPSNPYRSLWQGIWHDPTRLAFALYAFLPLWSLLVFDEGEDSVTTPAVIISFVIYLAGAFFYLRTPNYRSRILILFFTAILTNFLQFLVTSLFWNGWQSFGLDPSIKWWEHIAGVTTSLTAITIALLGPAVILELVRVLRQRKMSNPDLPTGSQ
jgi:hypothetical protein